MKMIIIKMSVVSGGRDSPINTLHETIKNLINYLLDAKHFQKVLYLFAISSETRFLHKLRGKNGKKQSKL